MPKVSIIIPYFNQDRNLLVRCVESALKQSYDDYEIIIVNDGSDYEHKTLLQNLYTGRDRIRIITTENQGVSAARNIGVQNAEGMFVTFLDADDELFPFFLKEAVSISECEAADFVIGGVRVVRTEQDECHENGSTNDRIKHKGKNDLQQLMINDLIVFEGGYIGRGAVSRLLNKDIALLVPFDVGVKIGEDIIWNLRLLDKCQKITVVKRVWYRYYENPFSVTNSFNLEVARQTTDELNIIMQMADLTDDRQYLAFCNHIFEELKKINDCLVNRKEWKASENEKKELIQKLYSSVPWKMVQSKRLYHLGNTKLKIKILLFRYRQLFRAWKYLMIK